jgi:hypothetical protein
LVGVPNVVQFYNIFESESFIVIHMEHLKGKNMKRDIKYRLQMAMTRMNMQTNETDTDEDSVSPKRRHEFEESENVPDMTADN